LAAYTKHDKNNQEKPVQDRKPEQDGLATISCTYLLCRKDVEYAGLTQKRRELGKKVL